MSDLKYDGFELEYFDNSTNFRKYQLNLIKKFLKKFPKIYFKKQYGKSNFIKRRHPKDSKLNINKSLKSQFNLLRVNDNELYPSFFYYKKKKYLIKIFKEKKS